MRLRATDLYGRAVRAEVHVGDDAALLTLQPEIGATATMRQRDASDTLRAMLREIDGPSLPDVRRAYGIDGPLSRAGEMRHVNGMWRVYVSSTQFYEGEQQDDALRAAWDARPGVMHAHQQAKTTP